MSRNRSTFAFVASIALLASASFAQSTCTVDGTVQDLGPSCGNPSPKFSVTAPKIGSGALLCVDSNLPGTPGTMNGHLFVFASFPNPPYISYPYGSGVTGNYGDCFVYVNTDPNVLVYAIEGQTDAQGDWCGFFPLPPDINLVGQVINLQARVWFPGGPFEAGDHLSNGIQVRIGCDNVSGLGKTPGFWKQSQHFKYWAAPYTPNTLFSAVFDDAFPGKTLLQVLQLGGGGVNALGRHTVAALLNAANPIYQSPLTAAQVITLFNGSVPGSASGIEMLKNYFEANNQAGES